MLGSPMRNGYIRALPAALAAWLAFQPLQAQIGPDEARSRSQSYRPSTGLTLRTQVELVEVPVVVRDRKRQPVAGLTKEDFTVTDSGKKQDVLSFSVETFTPKAGEPAAAATATASLD